VALPRLSAAAAQRLLLDRNPAHVVADIEQAAFSPSHFVPGIEASSAQRLQGRIVSYPDAHRSRLGANFAQLDLTGEHLPVADRQRDGAMRRASALASVVTYRPTATMAGHRTLRKRKYLPDRRPGGAQHLLPGRPWR